MKYPIFLPASDVLAHLDDYDSIIDVRSESEFALDHVPGAINCPVLNDLERVQVGTIYKQNSAFEAKKMSGWSRFFSRAWITPSCFFSPTVFIPTSVPRPS